MKTLSFYTNTYNCNTRDIIELTKYVTNELRYVDSHIVVMFRDEFPDPQNEQMRTVLFNIQEIVGTAKDTVYKRYVYRMYRANDFSCYNIGLTPVEKFEDYKNTK